MNKAKRLARAKKKAVYRNHVRQDKKHAGVKGLARANNLISHLVRVRK